ncbi:hypothetical protein [Caldalkalibacillus mannanilyticus]|uniref:hypothetical protein n=1 Tax=Caldalkalibacillus mannanilyticus TaxID=1418 RepID=UPI0004685561|nr:hypothetical protein [Caldalkalibacillus mannanilyticus]
MIYLQPQYRTTSGEILNVISNNGQQLGYLVYLFKDKEDLYILGHLDEVGEKQNYIDLIIRFISGLKDACGTKEDPFVRIQCGGEQIDLQKMMKEQENEE